MIANISLVVLVGLLELELVFSMPHVYCHMLTLEICQNYIPITVKVNSFFFFNCIGCHGAIIMTTTKVA